ncbi:hypothetical protein NX059_007717 [Plenodomus lindquistii]|nr:hypothetical protein NX059_007717 [Plenodomus lindquistii]
MTDPEFQTIVDGINAVGGPGHRNVDAARSHVNSAHEQKLPILMELRQHAMEVREYLKEELPQHGVLSQAELYPLYAIPLSRFPPDLSPKAKRH